MVDRILLLCILNSVNTVIVFLVKMVEAKKCSDKAWHLVVLMLRIRLWVSERVVMADLETLLKWHLESIAKKAQQTGSTSLSLINAF